MEHRNTPTTTVEDQVGLVAVDMALPTRSELAKAVWGQSLEAAGRLVSRAIAHLPNALAELHAEDPGRRELPDFEGPRTALLDQLVDMLAPSLPWLPERDLRALADWLSQLTCLSVQGNEHLTRVVQQHNGGRLPVAQACVLRSLNCGGMLTVHPIRAATCLSTGKIRRSIAPLAVRDLIFTGPRDGRWEITPQGAAIVAEWRTALRPGARGHITSSIDRRFGDTSGNLLPLGRR